MAAEGSTSTHRLLSFARELQRAATFEDLLAITRTEVMAGVGYKHAWLFVSESESVEELRLLDAAGGQREAIWDVAPVLTVRGDAMLEEIVSSDRPVVVVDARVDPRTNKDIVASLGNRTIVNVPLRLLDKPFGAFGTGTFADEGCRPPKAEQIDYLIGMAGQLAVAAGRIRFLEERRRGEEERRAFEARLSQVQKLEAVGRLAGGVAHDFNNLLTVISMYATMLLNGSPDSPNRDALEQIKRAGERAADLTRQLLAFGRRQVVAVEVLDINEVVERVDKMLARVLGEDIELKLSLAPDLDRVRSDSGQLEQVLMNLVVNARDAMPSGGKLTISTANVELDEAYARAHAEVTPGRFVMLAVSDTGSGMDKATQARAFEPFFTTKERGRGTGLGLSSVFGIVKQSGGSVWIYSEPGAGTTLKLYLPRALGNAVTVARPAPPAVAGGSETILLVEDDKQVRRIAALSLRGRGYRVLEAAGPTEALTLAAESGETIELLLTDVVMPKMNGRALYARIAAARPNVRVLFMSGYTDDAILDQGVLAADVAFVEKPLTPLSLARSVRRVLDSAR